MFWVRLSFYSYYSVLPAPEFGLNSGIMLMDLAKMRARHWRHKVTHALDLVKNYLLFGDQVRFRILNHSCLKNQYNVSWIE